MTEGGGGVVENIEVGVEGARLGYGEDATRKTMWSYGVEQITHSQLLHGLPYVRLLNALDDEI
jgi:hypothetical protein